MNMSPLFQTLIDTTTLGWGELCVVGCNPAPVKNKKNMETYVPGWIIGNLKM